MSKNKRRHERRRITTDEIKSLWCNLPENVLILILERLFYIDQIHFRAVCKDWRSKIYGVTRYADSYQWLLTVKGHRPDHIHNSVSVGISNLCYLHDPIHKQKYTIQNQVLFGARIHASKYGWLLLSREIHDQDCLKLPKYSTYVFSFYSPFTNKIIDLPLLEMEYSCKFFRNGQATFSAAPTSLSDCVICVISLEYDCNEFCVSTCSPGDKTWTNLVLGINNNGYTFKKRRPRISRVAYMEGVFYFTFNEEEVMGAFKPGLHEWKAYPYPFHDPHSFMDCLVESLDDHKNLFMAYYSYGYGWRLWRFNKTEMDWSEVVNLGRIMVFLSAISTSSIQEGEGVGSLASSIHVADSYKNCDCSSQFYNTLKRWSCPQVYDWLEDKIESYDSNGKYDHIKVTNWLRERLRKVWIQPPHIT